MSGVEEKKQYEQSILRQFLRRIGRADDGFRQLDPPEPDFELVPERIGLELTRLMKSQKLHEDELLIQKWLAEQSSSYVAAGGTGDVYFSFEEEMISLLLDRARRAELSAVSKFLHEAIGQLGIGQFESNLIPGVCQRWVRWIQVEQYSELPHWERVHAEFVDIDIDTIDRIVQRKSGKISRYLTDFSEKWLLINSSSGKVIGRVSTNDTFASAGYVNREILDHAFTSEFDRIFILDFTGRVYSLNITNQTAV